MERERSLIAPKVRTPTGSEDRTAEVDIPRLIALARRTRAARHASAEFMRRWNLQRLSTGRGRVDF